jgi:hypothetical protein
MPNNNDKKLGWHFLPADMKLEYGDGRKAEVGKTLSIDKNAVVRCCSTGMHASERPSQAAVHGKGPVLCRVEVSGDIEDRVDKFAGRSRKVIAFRKLTIKDIKAVIKGIDVKVYGDTLSDHVAALASAASSHADLVDKRLKALMSGNLPFTKPVIDEKTLISLLSRRMVRTAKELQDAVKGSFDISNWDDVLDDFECDAQVLVVDDWGKNYEKAYLLAA